MRHVHLQVVIEGRRYSDHLLGPSVPKEDANKVLIKQEFSTFSQHGQEYNERMADH